jgi:hypothetical protein
MGRMWSSCSACWQLARHRQYKQGNLMAEPDALSGRPSRDSCDIEADRTNDANRTGSERRTVMGVSTAWCMLGWPARSRLSTCLVSGGSALRLSMAGYLFTLRILREPDAGPQRTSSPSSSWWLPVSQPTFLTHTLSILIQTVRCMPPSGQGLVELQPSSSPCARLQPLPPHCAG